MVETRRIFIAVNLPEHIKKGIYEKLGSKIPKNKCKVVEMQNLHITMKFLGYMSDEALHGIEDKMRIIENFKNFEAAISGIGDFNGRVIWLGITKGSKELIEISNAIDDALSLHDEKFHPHITIARDKMLRKNETNELLEKLKAENYLAEIKVESIDIMESRLAQKGPEYSVVKRFALKD